MDYIYLKARAKINISLDVVGKRTDGYHDLKMIMQTVNLCDYLFIKKSNLNGITLSTNLKWLPNDNRNLVYKAAQYLIENYKIKDGIHIELTKNIPVSAGLAGGSADCAAALIGIRNLYNLHLTNSDLKDIGKSFGADVPYCIMRGTALAEGIGEKLKKLPPFPNIYVILVKPPINVSTASVFKKLKLDEIKKHPETEKIINYIKNKDIINISNSMCNVLETVTINDYPIIDKIKKSMIENDAIGSMMSGSGPTVFGFFYSKQSALNAIRNIRKTFHIKDCFLTTIYNKI